MVSILDLYMKRSAQVKEVQLDEIKQKLKNSNLFVQLLNGINSLDDINKMRNDQNSGLTGLYNQMIEEEKQLYQSRNDPMYSSMLFGYDLFIQAVIETAKEIKGWN